MKKLIIVLFLFITSFSFAQKATTQTFPTVLTDLKASVGTSGIQAIASGLTTPNDGNGGTFIWDAASVLADNGMTVIQVTGVTTGRWLRVSNSNVTKGSAVFNGELLKTAYVVNHGLGFVPAQVYIQPTSVGAAVISWVSNKTATTFTVNFLNVLNVGVNNITFDYLVIKF